MKPPGSDPDELDELTNIEEAGRLGGTTAAGP